jgi:hypothetical protein
MVRGGGFRQLNFEFLIILSRIWKTIWQHPQWGYFDEFKIGRVA